MFWLLLFVSLDMVPLAGPRPYPAVSLAGVFDSEFDCELHASTLESRSIGRRVHAYCVEARR